jgi:hypothetical protein
MFEWFGATSEKMERNATPLIDSWQKAENGVGFEKVCDLIRVDDVGSWTFRISVKCYAPKSYTCTL